MKVKLFTPRASKIGLSATLICFAFKLDMFDPLDPLIKLNPQFFNCTVPSVHVMVNGMLIMNILFVKVPEKSKVSPAFNFPEIMFPLPLK